MAERTPEMIAQFDQDIAMSRSAINDLITGYRAARDADDGDDITAMNWLLNHLHTMPSLQGRDQGLLLLTFTIYQLVQDQLEGERLASLADLWESNAHLSRNSTAPVAKMRTRMLDATATELRQALGLPPQEVSW